MLETLESFMLTVRGESMIEAGILNGDYILVKNKITAENGEIVVALIEDEATVKTFIKKKTISDYNLRIPQWIR